MSIVGVGFGRLQAAGEPGHYPQRRAVRVCRLLPRYRQTLTLQKFPNFEYFIFLKFFWPILLV